MPTTDPIIHRFVTDYNDTEDRIRLVCETDAGPVILWLTQRLLQRLVPALVRWLEQQQGRTSKALTAFAFAQSSARKRRIPPQLPSWLVRTVSLHREKGQIRLTFKADASRTAAITLAIAPLYKWLELLYDAYLAAQWPLTAWPAWVTERASVFSNNQPAVWH
jgi:hypothetical protein